MFSNSENVDEKPLKHVVCRYEVEMSSMSPEFRMFVSNVNLKYPGWTLSDSEIAEILGIHRETVYRMRKKGEGPKFAKIGKKVLCLKDDFFNWFQAQYSANNLQTDSVLKEHHGG